MLSGNERRHAVGAYRTMREAPGVALVANTISRLISCTCVTSRWQALTSQLVPDAVVYFVWSFVSTPEFA